MKSKYMSRKFILAMCWVILAVIAMVLSKDALVYLASVPSIAFILGESIVDAHSCVKQSKTVDLTEYHDVKHEVKKGE